MPETEVTGYPWTAPLDEVAAPVTIADRDETRRGGSAAARFRARIGSGNAS